MVDRKHLSPEQLASLWQDRKGQLTASEGARHAEAGHVASCETCRSQWNLLGAAAQDLKPLPRVHNSEAGSACPAEERLRELAGGTLTSAEAEALLEHAATCRHCGAVLRAAAESFQDEMSSEEKQVIAAMSSGQPGWQRQLAARLSATSAAGEPPASAMPRARSARLGWVLAAAAVLVATLGVGVAWRMTRERGPDDVSQLLARAYTERRPMELRIAGAQPAPIRLQRGPAGSTMDRPVPLTEAEAIISKKLAASPNDPAWLAARGRAELLNWRYDEAIKVFEQARDYGNASPDLLIDLASAYFQRAEANPDRAVDYGKAIELLGETLQKKPGDPVALFNRAVACERFFLYEQAVIDLQAFLRIPGEEAWATEARALLSRIEKIKGKTGGAREPPVADALQAAAYLKRRSLEPLAPEAADFLDETLQTVALQKWLVAGGNAPQSRADRAVSAERLALEELARALERRHGDSWLQELLKDADVPAFSRAAAALQDAIESNARADFAGAVSQAREAELLFSRMKNKAGLLRARREHTLALRRLLRGSDCVRLDPRPLFEESRDRYVWLKSEALLELASCYAMVGEAGEAESLVQAGASLAKNSGYGSLQLLALAFSATYGRGDSRAWATYREGLQRYWEQPVAPVSGLEFYVGLRELAEYSNWRHLAYEFALENVAMVTQTKETALLVPAYYRLATAARRIGAIPEATNSLALAYRAYAALPAEMSRALTVPLELSQAKLEGDGGNYAAAIRRLEDAQPLLAELSNDWIAFDVHSTLAGFYHASGKIEQAETSYWEALRIAWSRIGTLENEETRLRNEDELLGVCRSLVELISLKKGRSEEGLTVWKNCRRLHARPAPGKLEPSPPAQAKPLAGPAVKAILAGPREEIRETTLTVVLLGKQVGVWVSGQGTTRFHVLEEDAGRVIQVGRRFAKLCADPASSLEQIRDDGSALFRWFFAPLGSEGRTNRKLLVDADQAFVHIPWQAITDSRGQSAWDLFDVALLPAGESPSEDPADTYSAQSKILIVADPRGDAQVSGGLPPLNGALEEAQHVAAHFSNPFSLVGTQASARTVLARLPGQAIFHFAGHAVWDSRSGFLVLSDRTVETSEILKQGRLSSRLVVLAACSTGEAENGLADHRSLVRAFLARGARNVIAAGWRVDSNTTTSLMDAFYGELVKGSSVSASLRRAVHSVKGQGNAAHPYYWAAFSIYGRG